MDWTPPWFFLFVSAACAVAIRSAAQDANAEVNGRITDSSGEAVPGVTATDIDTSISPYTQEQRIRRTFVNAQPGNYKMSISAPGFKQTALPAF